MSDRANNLLTIPVHDDFKKMGAWKIIAPILSWQEQNRSGYLENALRFGPSSWPKKRPPPSRRTNRI